MAVLLLFATTVPAIMMLDDQLSSAGVPAVGSGSSAPGSSPSEPAYNTASASFQEGQPRNTYPYPIAKQYSTYYGGSPPSQYGRGASAGGNVEGGYPQSTAYQNGQIRVAPQYSTYSGYTKMAITKPYAYYAPGAYYRGSRKDIDEDAQDGDNSNPSAGDQSPTAHPVLRAVNRAFNPGAITGTGHRSLLDLPGYPEPAVVGSNGLSSFNSLSSIMNLQNARVSLSVSGGYPTNTPRLTYLTFIIPGDICSLNEQEGSFRIGSQTSGFINQQLPYESTYGTYVAPATAAAGAAASLTGEYGTAAGQYSNVQSRAVYSNGQQVYGAQQVINPIGVYGTYGGNGLITGTAAATGAFITPGQRDATGVRSLEESNKPMENSKPSLTPLNPPAPAPESQPITEVNASVPQTSK